MQKTRECELCKRKAKPEGTYYKLLNRIIHINLLPRPPYKLLCQYCRGKLNRY